MFVTMNAPASRKRAIAPAVLALLGAAWILVVGTGFLALWIYKLTPAEQRATPPRWPVESRIPRAPARFTLVLFAHPQCACTRASLSGLAEVMARFHDRLDAVVALAVPGDGRADSNFTGDLQSSARRIPGVTLLRDTSGVEAHRFGAATSGAVALYDPAGRLAFHGGLTPARGHEGDSFGLRRIAAILDGRSADRPDAPVFGCALQDDDSVLMAHQEPNQPTRGNR